MQPYVDAAIKSCLKLILLSQLFKEASYLINCCIALKVHILYFVAVQLVQLMGTPYIRLHTDV